MLTDDRINEIASAFDGLVTDDGNVATIVRDTISTGLVNLTADEVEAIAGRILELQAIVSQNALVRGDNAPSTVFSDGWSE